MSIEKDRSLSRKKYYIKNRQRLLEKRRAYYYANREKQIERSRLYRKNNQSKVKQQHRKYYLKNYAKVINKKFDIDYYALLEKQNGCCAICGIHFDECCNKLSVDHDHETGKVRELLCNNCNVGLGNFKERVYLLESAIKYLNKHKNEYIKKENT